MKDLMELVEDAEKNPAKIVEKAIDLSKEEIAFKQAEELLNLGMLKVGKELMEKAGLARRMRLITEGKYIAISPAHIQNFLNRRADELKTEYQKEQEESMEKVTRNSFGSAVSIWRTLIENQQISDDNSRFLVGPAMTFTGNSTVTPMNQLSSSELSRAMARAQLGRFAGAAGAGSALGGLGGFLPSQPAESLSAWSPKGSVTWLEVDVAYYDGIPPVHALTRLKDERAKCLFDSFTIASVLLVKDPLLLGRVKGSDKRFFLAQWGEDIKIDDLI